MTEATKGPWVQFLDKGKCVAIMPAGRAGDVCTFEQPPNEADAALMTAAPEMAVALLLCQEVIRYLQTTGTDERAQAQNAVRAALSKAGLPQ